MNDELAAVASSGTANIVNTVLEVLGGNENNDDVLDMVSKAKKAKKATHNELLALADTSFNFNLGRHESRRGPKPGSKNKTKDEKEISDILSDMSDAVALKNDPQVKFRKNKKNLKLIEKYAQLIK